MSSKLISKHVDKSVGNTISQKIAKKKVELKAEEFWGKILTPEKTSGNNKLYGRHWGPNGFEYLAYPE